MAQELIKTNSEKLLERLAFLSEQELADLIVHHNKKYFVDAKPEISDEAFDKLVEALKFINPNSIVLSFVGHAAFGQEVVHLRPMLSLDKCYDDQSFFKWAEKIKGDLVAMPKIDGIASSLIYSQRGELLQAATRGDGIAGENITKNISVIDDIPIRLPEEICQKISNSEQFLEIRGEVYLPLTRFKQKYAEEFANPRNLAGGALKQKDPKKSKEYGLRFLPYDIRGTRAQSESEKFSLIESLGFELMPWRLIENNQESTEAMRDFFAKRSTFDFELDGVVYRANNLSDQIRLGETAHHPRYALAYKFQGESAASELQSVEWSVSRSGAITPVAIINPVFISGAHVARASLHNLGIFLSLDLREQSLLEVERRGGVIPHVERVLSKKGVALSYPETCPSCHSPTEIIGDFLYCSAKQQCRVVRASVLIHFCAVLGIEGMGEKIIYKLLDNNLIKSFEDIFRLSLEDLLGLERMGKVLANKLLQEIANKHEISLSVFLRALGIEEVGTNVSELVASNFHTLERVRNLSVLDLTSIQGIGERIAEALVNGLKEHDEEINKLLSVINVKDFDTSINKADQSNALYGKSVVFTGKMAHLERKSAQNLVKSLGGTAPGAISAHTNYLVVGDEGSPLLGQGQKSSKQKDAEKLIAAGSSLRIISESEFLRLSGQ